MIRRTLCLIALLICAFACCSPSLAQTTRTITLRMLNNKTGKLIETSHFLIRVDREQTVHANWVTLNEDGTGKLTLPKNASLLLVQATYDSAELIYTNCDSATGKGSPPAERWYSIAEILATGIAVPDSCRSAKQAAKFKTVAKPGELVFFVRQHNWNEEFKEDYSSR